MNFHSHHFHCNGQTLHTKIAGPEHATVVLMLHGFPEYWAAWEKVGAQLADSFRVVLPDQRGFNLSSKPVEREAYETKHLVADMLALVDQISPDAPVILCGHDWGASVAYAFAMRHCERVSKLVIANGVHPVCFQKALLSGGPQTDASQYMNVLRAEGSEEQLSRDDFRPLLNMFEKFSAAPWLTDEVKTQYRKAWAQDGALSAMLNWYRGSPMVVPVTGAAPKPLPITAEMEEKYRISMPHLLLWGNQDVALLPEARVDLPKFCDQLLVVETEEASHWILHEKPEWVASHIKKFVTAA
jgi:pimeloyl-ACP methyl ester carboxylesterase